MRKCTRQIAFAYAGRSCDKYVVPFADPGSFTGVTLFSLLKKARVRL
jgi:hypothetical protein